MSTERKELARNTAIQVMGKVFGTILGLGTFWFLIHGLDDAGFGALTKAQTYASVFAILVDPTTYFLGRDTDVDIRRYQLNFATTFPGAMDGFFRGMLGEDWGNISPRMAGTSGTLVWPDPLQLEDGSMGGTPIDPAVGFSIQLFAGVFGMSYIPQTYDEHFLQSEPGSHRDLR